MGHKGTRGRLNERNHCAGSFELAFRFFRWADALKRVPLPEEIVREFSTSLAHAYRWRNQWCAANGLPQPDRRPAGSRPAHLNAAQRHAYRVRTQDHRETTKPGGNRHPFLQTTVQGH